MEKAAGWLGGLARIKCPKKEDSPRWKILFFEHIEPDPASTTIEQLRSIERLKAWRTRITEGCTFSDVLVRTFRGMAEEQTEKE